MPKLCRCGAIVERECKRCSQKSDELAKQKTAERGYGNDHKMASDRYRRIKPLCERCVMIHGAIAANPSAEMHHIYKIATNPHLRMVRDNWLALCRFHHEELENDLQESLKTKQWSEANYERILFEIEGV